jgi:4-hydroxy-tetrahydrodipicolinate synthase
LSIASPREQLESIMHRIGLNCALSTAFDTEGRVDVTRTARHAAWVMANGCDGITLFGTTGEGASVGVSERHRAFGGLAAAGIDIPASVIGGVLAASREEIVAQARAAYAAGCKALLLAPPFYFGDVPDDGVFACFARIFDALGSDLRDVILYHIPGMTKVSISVEVTRRLAEAYPGVVIGVKDSNGDWPATERRLKELPGMQILVGDERQLAKAVRNGGSGTICGLANVAPDLLRPLAHEGHDDARIGNMVDAILGYSFMSAIKSLVADLHGDEGWRPMRPPLMAMAAADSAVLARAIAAARALKAA